MWILVADGLLELLKKHGYLSQGFADDFSVLVEGIDLSTACNIGQFAMLQIEKWCKMHGLSVNPKKTEMVLFTRKRKLNGFKPIQIFQWAARGSMYPFREVYYCLSGGDIRNITLCLYTEHIRKYR